MTEKKILIVGAGFGGIRCALDLASYHPQGVKVTLVNPTPHFEYHAMLYRVLTGRSPLEVCVPLTDIFQNKNIEVVEDSITDVNFEEKKTFGKSDSIYRYDYLVLGLGSETAYYDIPGLKDWSFSMKSISEILDLKMHLHELFSEASNDNNESLLHFIIVGGGATGVEAAGELSVYAKKLAEKHTIDPTRVTIDLITSSSRLVPQAQNEMSEKIRFRLGSLGVNVYLNRRVMKEEVEEIYMKDMRMKTKTVFWTAGVRGNELYRKFGLPVNSKGQVIVNSYLQPFMSLKKEFTNVFVLGDGAHTKYSGMVKTALHDGRYIADSIMKILHGKKPDAYLAEKPNNMIPVGSKWAASELYDQIFYGMLGWYIKRFNDLKFFLSILPFPKAITAWREDGVLWESCSVCRGEIY